MIVRALQAEAKGSPAVGITSFHFHFSILIALRSGSELKGFCSKRAQSPVGIAA